MSSITCEFCFAQFTSSAPAGAETVQCPDCGEETSAEADDAAESGGFTRDGSDDVYDIGTIEVTGELISDDDAPAVLPARRKKKKTGKRKKKKVAAQSSGNAATEVFGSIIDILTGYPKLIAGILVWAVFMVAYCSGIFESREQEVFYNLTGQGRTTGEWLAVVRNYEEQSTDGNISDRAKWLYQKISEGMSTFLGPDPQAIPDLFRALQENPKKSTLPRLAETVLEKFQNNNRRPLVGDLEDGLESGHPKVILWSIRLLALHGAQATGDAGAVADFLDSDDQEIADAARETLAKIK